MKATMQTDRRLIADVLVPEGSTYTYVNRRGNEMTVDDNRVVMTQHVHDHYCYEHAESDETQTYRQRLDALWAGVVVYMQQVWAKLPNFTPKKYTATDGLQTDWKATLPPKSVLASSATLAVIALGLNIAVALQPQPAAPTAPINPRPISATTVSQDREVLSAENPLSIETQADQQEFTWSPSGAARSSTTRTQNSTVNTTPSPSPTSSQAPVVTPPATATPPEVVVPPVQEPVTPAPEEPAPTDPESPIEIPIVPEVIEVIAP